MSNRAEFVLVPKGATDVFVDRLDEGTASYFEANGNPINFWPVNITTRTSFYVEVDPHSAEPTRVDVRGRYRASVVNGPQIEFAIGDGAPPVVELAGPSSLPSTWQVSPDGLWIVPESSASIDLGDGATDFTASMYQVKDGSAGFTARNGAPGKTGGFGLIAGPDTSLEMIAEVGQTEPLFKLHDSDLVRVFAVLPDGTLVAAALPTADPAIAGALWNDAGTLKVSAG